MSVPTSDISAFLERVRARRAEAGKPDNLETASVYRLLDGLLAKQPQARAHEEAA